MDLMRKLAFLAIAGPWRLRRLAFLRTEEKHQKGRLRFWIAQQGPASWVNAMILQILRPRLVLIPCVWEWRP